MEAFPTSKEKTPKKAIPTSKEKTPKEAIPTSTEEAIPTPKEKPPKDTFNAQSELATNRRKHCISACGHPSLAIKVCIQHKPTKGKHTAVTHNNIDNTLAPHTNLNYNSVEINLLPEICRLLMQLRWLKIMM